VPTVADIYSAADSLKRRLSDAASNPIDSFMQMVGNANDRAGAYNQQLSDAAREPLTGPKTMALASKMAQGYSPGGMITEVPGYGMFHRPMTIEQGAAPLHDLTRVFDENIYNKNAVPFYGTGSPRLDNEVVKVFQQVKDKPNAQVTIYRAIPKNVNQKEINHGDWVTVSKEYAMEHGEGPLEGNYKIISKKVPASHVTTNADSILEQGYYPTDEINK